MNTAKGATVVFGGQVGSEGKGAVVGYLARRYDYAASICTFMTNAGHTYVSEDGEKVVVQQLPVAMVSPKVQILAIGPSSAITIEQLFNEIYRYDGRYSITRRLMIDPRAVIIDDTHRQIESEITKRVGSTMKGCGAALAHKVMRHPDVRLARDVRELMPFLGDTVAMVNALLDNNCGVMVEGSQGFDLDINHGIDYPECTSRQCTPMQILADCGIDASFVTRNVAVVRSYPIRVGNIVENGEQVGYSGSFGAKELTWDEVTERSGSPTRLEERTTVTQRVRRVFEMDFKRLARMAMVCRPTDIALTFADYIDARLAGERDYYTRDGHVVSEQLDAFVCGVEQEIEDYRRRSGKRPRVSMIKTGPLDSDMIDMCETEWAG